MYIHKILNNNVVVVLDDKQREQIVMGRGIAFNKKCGDDITSEQIDKVFALSNPDTNNRFQELISDIPLEYLELVEKIITYTKTHLGKKVDDAIYISLVDHVYMSVMRYLQGIEVKNALLWDIKRFYKDEFFIGMKALDMIENELNVRLPDDEAGFIALHIVNAQMEEDEQTNRSIYEITKVMQEITNIVRYYFNITFDEDSVYYYRFVSHLKFFAQRLCSGKTYTENSEDELLDIIKLKYKSSYECVIRISSFIQEKYKYVVSKEEQLYLTIHIERVVYKSES
ncbi:MAG: PRD domain-containing protein [Longicatena sp.]